MAGGLVLGWRVSVGVKGECWGGERVSVRVEGGGMVCNVETLLHSST